MITATAQPLSGLQKWIEATCEALSLDPTGLARRAMIAQSTITRIVNGETTEPSARTLAAIARISPVAPPPEVRRALDGAPVTGQERNVNIFPGDGTDVPIWGVHPVERDGIFRLNPIPLQHLRRPAHFGGSRRLVAFYAPDETMAPRWQMGEPVVVDLARPGTMGAYALIRLTPPEDPNADEVFLFRRYVGRSNGHLILEALSDTENPIRIPLERLLEVRRVLDWSDMLG